MTQGPGKFKLPTTNSTPTTPTSPTTNGFDGASGGAPSSQHSYLPNGNGSTSSNTFPRRGYPARWKHYKTFFVRNFTNFRAKGVC